MSVTVWRGSSQVPACAHVVLALEHQRARRADADAVAAVDAGGLGQRRGELGRDARVEAAAGDGDRERVLRLDAAGLDALVAEDALRVVADVEVVVDLDGLGDRRGRPGADRRGGGPGMAASRCARGGRRRGRAEARRDPRRSAPSSPGPRARRTTGRPRRPGTRGRACATGARARCRSGRSSSARPGASRRARARASPRPRRRRRGRR